MSDSIDMSVHLEHVFAVILAGGSGTRLWPKSRDNSPKQFLRLGGERTMLQVTYDRIAPMIPAERIIIVTNALYTEEVKRELPQIPAANIIAEPAKRDTAMAMALGAVVAQHLDPQAVVMNIASDHVLKDEDEYRSVMAAAVKYVQDGQHLLAIGITPTGPNVNFGYIQSGEVVSETMGRPVHVVKRFKEKPDLATAEQFLAAGSYYWNACMFTWTPSALLAAFKQYQPEMLVKIEKIQAAIGQSNWADVLATEYAAAPKIAIDVAIAEKVDNLVIIAGDFGWDDVGLWSTVYDLGQKNENESVVVRESADNAQVVELDSHNNLINTNGRLIAAIGLQDMVIIDSKDVLLVLPRDRAADVKKIVAELQKQKLEQYL
jgi:mannose-1-phosphate guanylyltransferase